MRRRRWKVVDVCADVWRVDGDGDDDRLSEEITTISLAVLSPSPVRRALSSVRAAAFLRPPLPRPAASLSVGVVAEKRVDVAVKEEWESGWMLWCAEEGGRWESRKDGGRVG